MGPLHFFLFLMHFKSVAFMGFGGSVLGNSVPFVSLTFSALEACCPCGVWRLCFQQQCAVCVLGDLHVFAARD